MKKYLVAVVGGKVGCGNDYMQVISKNSSRNNLLTRAMAMKTALINRGRYNIEIYLMNNYEQKLCEMSADEAGSAVRSAGLRVL